MQVIEYQGKEYARLARRDVYDVLAFYSNYWSCEQWLNPDEYRDPVYIIEGNKLKRIYSEDFIHLPKRTAYYIESDYCCVRDEVEKARESGTLKIKKLG